MPNVDLVLIKEIESPKLVSTPLSRALVGKKDEVLGFDNSTLQTGFLSLDQDKRVFALLSDFWKNEPNLPTVGIWLYGVQKS